MKLKKRKIKYSAIFFICWFAVLVFLVDGVLKFQTLVDYFGSNAISGDYAIAIGHPAHNSSLQINKGNIKHEKKCINHLYAPFFHRSISTGI